MVECARQHRLVAVSISIICALSGVSFAYAQAAEAFVTGSAAAAYEKWQAAMEAILNRANPDAAETAFTELMALNPSPLRIALLAERSILRNEGGGGVLLLEED